jgi:rod shape-determining protein MreD
VKAKSAEPVEGLGPKLVPVTLTVLFAIFSVVPLQIPGYAAVTPSFVLISIFHWTIYRPEHMPYLAVFLIGLFVDLLTSAPGSVVGLSSLIFLMVRSVVLDQRRFFAGKSFPVLWWGFAVAAIAVDSAYWAGDSAVSASVLEARGFAFQAVLTIAFFPILTLLFARIQRVTAASA